MTQARSREEMDVDVTKPPTREQISVDELQSLFIGCHDGGGKMAQCIQYLATVAQIPDSDFSDHEGMRQDPTRRQKQGYACAFAPEVVDPN